MAQTVPVHQFTAGRSVQNRPIEVIEIGQGADVCMIIATIHGNEAAGTPLVHALTDHIRMNPLPLYGRKVVVIPVANPDGLARQRRYNVNGVDLNRNFPGANRENNKRNGERAFTEPESVVLDRLIRQYQPDRIVSIHQPLSCIDYDGPGRELAEHMARYCDLAIRKLGARPGSLGTYAGEEMNIPIVTLELRSIDSKLDQDALWKKYGASLLAAIAYPDPIATQTKLAGAPQISK